MQISSISGTRPLPGGAANGAAKRALVVRSRSMCQEYRDEGIRVSLAHPGSIEANERPGVPAEEVGPGRGSGPGGPARDRDL